VFNPRKAAFARSLVSLAHKTINDVRLQPVNLENHHPLRLSESYGVREKKEKSGQ
jgi:hypothetical protein